MSAQPVFPGGLSRAHDSIQGLMSDLSSTIEQVEQLTASGDHEAALELVESQRRALYATVDLISSDVCVDRRRWYDPVTRHLTRHAAAAAAALLALSTIVSVGVLRDQSPRDTSAAEARQAIADARAVADPIERLGALKNAVGLTKRVPADEAARPQISRDLLSLIDDTRKNIEEDDRYDPRTQDGAITEAAALAESAEDPWSPPQTTPDSPLNLADRLTGPSSDDPGPRN